MLIITKHFNSMKNFSLLFIAVLFNLFAYCQTNTDTDSTHIPPQVIVTNEFKKHITFNPEVFSNGSAYSQAEIDEQKSNFIKSYIRATKLAIHNPDGTEELNATKESLNVSEELFNMVKYVFVNMNKEIKQIKEKKGDSCTIGSLSTPGVPIDLKNIDGKTLLDLYNKSNSK